MYKRTVETLISAVLLLLTATFKTFSQHQLDITSNNIYIE